MQVSRFEVYLINLDPAKGREIKKTRPCLIISPDEMNHFINTIIIAPMITKKHNYPSRANCKFSSKDCQIVLDQIRSVDKSRLIKKIGKIKSKKQVKVLEILQEMFAW